jgi:hypothetical protein
MEPDAPVQPRPEDEDATSDAGGVDLATLGLAVFFLAVIAVVGALLLVQTLF